MSKGNQSKKNDEQNRCRRCDRPLKDPNARSGIVNESVTIYGDRRWEKDKDAYDRFVWCDVPNMEDGKHMFQHAANIFSNPGHYNVILYKGGQ